MATQGGGLGNTLPHPVPLADPFAQAMSQNRTGGYGNTYTNDVLNSLQPEGVNINQYQNLAKPGVAPPPTTGGGGGGGTQLPPNSAYNNLTPAQRLDLSGMGGAPHNSGATFAGGGANIQLNRFNMLSGPQGQQLLAQLGIRPDNRYAQMLPNGKQNPNYGIQYDYGSASTALPHQYQPNGLTGQTTAQAGHPLGLQPWQTQQAIGLGYHPMMPMQHPAAHIQNMSTGILHPNIQQDLLQGHIQSLFHGGGGGY